jgi:molybdenum cofactor synthesis domain-containing protein
LEKRVEPQKVALFVIGEEVLRGEVEDKNTPYFIRELHDLGVTISIACILPDSIHVISQLIAAFLDDVDYLILTGGIGPTPDDVTREAVAFALGLPLVTDLYAKRVLEDFYGDDISEARMKMAIVPVGSELIPNPVSSAPGFLCGKVMVFPGIPELIEKMFPMARKFFKKVSITRGIFYLKSGESTFSDIMEGLMDKYGDLSIGSYPSFAPGYRVRIVVRGTEVEKVTRCIMDFEQELLERGIEIIKKEYE